MTDSDEQIFTSWDARTGVTIELRGDDAAFMILGFHVNRDLGDEDDAAFHVEREPVDNPYGIASVSVWTGAVPIDPPREQLRKMGWDIAYE